MKIGIISDTHNYLCEITKKHLKECDEIWHAGDIGSIELFDELEKITKVRAVYGNIDSNELRITIPEHQRFTIEGFSVWMTHIGGYPGKYDRRIINEIKINPPDIFISGHSHILKIIPDNKLNLLHINPGAVGRSGLHKVRTIVIMELKNKKINDMKVVELSRR
ncbi:MAG: metallophosphoesterase family protein [Bacteroidota bacterium]|nr:metallophosphoesterase family protein [Bacteroidota bacterium]